MHAQINWSDQLEPFSTKFDDHYFNTEQGIKESQYVFLKANQLTERWLTWDSDFFSIAETGFGTGLNFLVTCHAFAQFVKANPQKKLKRLFFSSFEKYPLTHHDLKLALQKWPSLATYVPPLIEQYPLALTGCHRIELKFITLDLWFGDVNETLPSLYHYGTGLFDCWYLDGFSPSKNPEMWNSQLFELIATTAKHNASISTFTAAGFVRRGLEMAGFKIQKQKGYGKKREMLIGHLAEKKLTANYAQHYRPSKTTVSNDIAIIGGGISSACLSLALVKRGFKVTLYSQSNELATGASGNRQGALYPLLNEQHDKLSQLFANSYLYARNYVEKINHQHAFDFDFSGLLQLYYDESSTKKLDKILQAKLPQALVQALSCEQTDQVAQIDINQRSLYYPLAGWLSPSQMVKAIFDSAKDTGLLTIKLNHKLTKFKQYNNQWECHFKNQIIKHDVLVLATAMNSLDFEQCNALPLSSARGQVTHIESDSQLNDLAVTLCHEGYLTPQNNNIHCMGATFKRHNQDESFSMQEQADNKQKLNKCIKNKVWVEEINIDHQHAHVGIRCTTRDHFPYMGALPNYQQTKLTYQDAAKKMPSDNAPFHDNVFILTGLGSRGLNTAPLLAETLASQINKEPLPLSLAILNSLQCNRQWINYLKKGKTLKY